MMCAKIEERLEIVFDHARDGYGRILISIMCENIDLQEILFDHAIDGYGRILSSMKGSNVEERLEIMFANAILPHPPFIPTTPLLLIFRKIFTPLPIIRIPVY